MGLVVKSESFGSIIAGSNRHHRLQHDSDELSCTVIAFLHHPRSRVAVVEDGHVVCRAEMQIPEHVTGRKTGDQKLFRIVAGLIATESGIA